jgi:hypothetical protein
VTSQTASTPTAMIAGESKSMGTWDQKYFAQVQLSDSDQKSIQDMMLCLVRVALRCLLSREHELAAARARDGPQTNSCHLLVGRADVLVREYATEGLSHVGAVYFPSISSLKVVLSLDFKLLREGELPEEDFDRLIEIGKNSESNGTCSGFISSGGNSSSNKSSAGSSIWTIMFYLMYVINNALFMSPSRRKVCSILPI